MRIDTGSEHARRKYERRKTKVKVDGRREEDGCHKLEDTCAQKRLEDGREGGKGPTRTVEPWNSSSNICKIISISVQPFLSIQNTWLPYAVYTLHMLSTRNHINSVEKQVPVPTNT